MALETDKVIDEMLICVKCFADLRCETNGVSVARDPHYVQSADLYKCPECGYEVLTGAGQVHNVEYSKAVYNREAGRWKKLYKIDTKEVFEAEVVEDG